MTYQEIINLGLKKGISEIELYAKTSTDKTLKVFNGNLESYKGSHALNNLVLKKLFSDKANYDIVE